MNGHEVLNSTLLVNVVDKTGGTWMDKTGSTWIIHTSATEKLNAKGISDNKRTHIKTVIEINTRRQEYVC